MNAYTPAPHRERTVARRLQNLLPDIRTATKEENGSYSILLGDEADHFLLDVIERAQTAWEASRPATTTIATTDVLIQNCRTWLQWTADGWTPGAILLQIRRSQRDSVRYEYASMLFFAMLEALLNHAIFIFPQWPVDLTEISDGWTQD